MTQSLEAVARAMVAKGKGLLAADESFPTIEKRFKAIDLPSTEENRRAYRELLLTAPGIGDYISGVILFDETLRQRTADGTPFAKALLDAGVLPGIKVDKGAKALPFFAGEKFTQGLDGLRERLAEYRDLGAKFAKWRAVIAIDSDRPSQTCLDANANGLAAYAALCQEAGIVPIVEPEVLMDGDHSIDRCAEVTEATLTLVFAKLAACRVSLEGMILKPNMILPGKDCPQQASVETVAQATVASLKRCVPAAVPGIMFLSGGQSEALATRHLNAMNRLPGLPWELSFSYGRALQESALKTWGGSADRVERAAGAFIHRARCNSAARYGKYEAAMEDAV